MLLKIFKKSFLYNSCSKFITFMNRLKSTLIVEVSKVNCTRTIIYYQNVSSLRPNTTTNSATCSYVRSSRFFNYINDRNVTS